MASGGTATERRRRRNAGVIAASAIIHGLLLLGIGAHVPRADWRMHGLDQSVIQVELTRPPPPKTPKTPKPTEPPRRPEVQKRPEPPKPPEPAKRIELGKSAPTPARRPVEEKRQPAPQAPAPAVVPPRPSAPAAAAAPSTAAPASVPGRPSPWLVGPGSSLPPGFSGSLRTHLGCSDPNAAGLSRREREACKDRLAEGARDAPLIQAPMAPEKRAGYDRIIKCRRDYDNAPVPNNAGGWGLGYIPRLRDCRPGDH